MFINHFLQSINVGPHQSINDFPTLDEYKCGHGGYIVLCRHFFYITYIMWIVHDTNKKENRNEKEVSFIYYSSDRKEVESSPGMFFVLTVGTFIDIHFHKHDIGHDF